MLPPVYSIQRLRREHLREVVAIEEVVQYEPWSYRSFLDELSSPPDFSWVLSYGDHVIGYLCARIITDELEILNVAIHPSFQQQGHGRRLLQFVLTEAHRTHTVSTVYLEVRESNEAAHHLYRSLGFLVVGERRNYYRTPQGRETAVLMARKLPLPPSPHRMDTHEAPS